MHPAKSNQGGFDKEGAGMVRKESMKKLPVGIEDFGEIRSGEFYYVDKTAMIRELLNGWGKVNLFTRPRRFGKSLNMSMLRSFFEIGCDRTLFDGLLISKEYLLCEKYMGKFPVIFISLKGIQADSFEKARNLIVKIINAEARRLQYLLDSENLSEYDKAVFLSLLDKDMDEATLCNSLYCFSELLRKHHGQKVILLIDEYDVPLAKASEQDFYEQMVNLIQNMFEQALKTNEHLYFSVLTGCLRVSKESIFTGLNNPKILSVTDIQFDEYFGFTDCEVRDMLEYYHISESYDEVKRWYDGYHFGNVDVYCPWDVISFCDKRKDDPNLYPEDYWSNTSSNDIVRRFLQQSTAVTRGEIEKLIAGESVTKVIKKELTYKDLYNSVDNLWSVLFTTGYLTQCGMPDKRNRNKLMLTIPNEEVRNIFMNQITEWMQDVARENVTALEAFCEAFRNGNAYEAQEKFSEYLNRTVSVRDTAVREDLKENFYHGFLLGLLRYKEDWNVMSNRESGDGYANILIEICDEKTGIVIEVKYADRGNLDAACEEALRQIENKRYTDRLLADGMRKILKYGIACHGKNCKVIRE